MRTVFKWLAILLLILVVALILLVLFAPRLLISSAEDTVSRLTHREMKVTGGAEMRFLPHLGVNFKHVEMKEAGDNSRPFMRAEQMIVPVSVSDLFHRDLKFGEVTLVNPSFDFRIAEKSGLTAGGIPQEEVLQNNQNTAGLSDLTLHVQGGAIHYIDKRNDQVVGLEDVTAKIKIRNGDELDGAGTVSYDGQYAHVEAHIASMQRIMQDGSPADVTLKSDTMQGSFSGRLSTRDQLGLAGTLKASSDDFRKFTRWINAPLSARNGFKNFNIAAGVDLQGKRVKFTGANLTLDEMTANGDLALDFSKKKPRIDAVLNTNLFSLDPYLSDMFVTGGNLSEFPMANADWSLTPYNFTFLKSLDANISLSTLKFKWGTRLISPMEFSTVLEDGHLLITVPNAPVYGGNVTANLALDTSTPEPELEVSVTGANVNSKQIFFDAAQVNWLEGPANLKLDFKARGASPQTMVSTATGKFMLAVGQGAFVGLDVPKLMGQLNNALATAWSDSAGKLAPFDSMTVNFSLSDGIASTNDLTINAKDYRITGVGDIDILRQAINMRFDPILTTAGQTTMKLSNKVAVFGMWAAPKIFPDSPQLLPTPDATVRSGGMAGAAGAPDFLAPAPAPGKGNRQVSPTVQ